MEIHIDQILLQALNFGILMFVLTKFLYKPILKILEQRAEKIDSGLTAAQKSLEEKANLDVLKKEEMKKAEIQSAKIIEEAKAQAEVVAKNILEKAQKETAEAITKEETALRARLAKEESALVGKTADLVLSVTKSLLKDTLSPAHQQEIVASQLEQLKNIKLNK